ncbi:hypothetical protein A2763_04725 [Candidatus Kaiserbacteria bacterium RIFCSPHIGHO2_01_FULL_54_36]|uniref:Glycerophosphoryl diester phosphodiesterase membrane domain-containing protein n=1 Tax=Candidatus Kaiserbacteria bacterium RIFCSPHIGHO2_01_FULL_54_36 TaxID=1798482 RepID=A0A1F6CN08_9BACT|nr:MAG: hypothetical protein A2763_04725 [Candidatus Kaiserbacteria bacterium RIFCSPHIGHO2_01_FULL_54_36]OGG75071.1 MAG: hypothetical protein A3A41_02155 [Candidatus Kaiserbacteria bacterium RIFCSPLOWO2_01_FULL_54_22]
MNTFYVGKAVRVGWETCKAQPTAFLIAAIALTVLTAASDALQWLAFEGGIGGPFSPAGIAAAIAGLAVSIVASYWMALFTLQAHDEPSALSISAILRWDSLVPYTLGGILYIGGILIGAVFLIVPGIIFATVYIFAYLFIIDKRLGVIASFKESARITKGARWRIFGLLAATAGIILGGSALSGLVAGIVGQLLSLEPIAYYVALVIPTLAMLILSVSFVHAYRMLVGTKISDASA